MAKFNTKILTGSMCVNSLELLSKLTRVSKKTADSHLEENEKNWIEFKQNLGSRYIERQHDLDMFKYGSYRKNLQKMFMGEKPFTASRNSCEVISVYNALENLGVKNEDTTFPRLLNYFEKNASILKGYFGTSFTGVIRYFKKQGYDYISFMGKKINRENLDLVEKNYETYIFMSYNNTENIADMIHTMSITREEQGFFIHNSYCKPVFYETLYDAVVKYNSDNGFVSRPIIVMGINKPKEEEES
ncbi:MAG: hypothetical protein J6X80_00045 [Lachnospiraceae bacterium]|nr:hypothetical protein [Lachnospiraceae bacterium]